MDTSSIASPAAPAAPPGQNLPHSTLEKTIDIENHIISLRDHMQKVISKTKDAPNKSEEMLKDVEKGNEDVEIFSVKIGTALCEDTNLAISTLDDIMNGHLQDAQKFSKLFALFSDTIYQAEDARSKIQALQDPTEKQLLENLPLDPALRAQRKAALETQTTISEDIKQIEDFLAEIQNNPNINSNPVSVFDFITCTKKIYDETILAAYNLIELEKRLNNLKSHTRSRHRSKSPPCSRSSSRSVSYERSQSYTPSILSPYPDTRASVHKDILDQVRKSRPTQSAPRSKRGQSLQNRTQSKDGN